MIDIYLLILFAFHRHSHCRQGCC